MRSDGGSCPWKSEGLAPVFELCGSIVPKSLTSQCLMSDESAITINRIVCLLFSISFLNKQSWLVRLEYIITSATSFSAH